MYFKKKTFGQFWKMSFVFFKSDGWFLCNKDWPTEVELITCVGYDSIAAYM